MDQKDFYSDENRSAEENASGATVNKYSGETPNGEYRYSYKGGYSSQHPYTQGGYSQRYYSPYSNAYSQYTAPAQPAAPQKQKRTFGAGAIAAVIVAAIVLSAISGFFGVIIGASYKDVDSGSPAQSGSTSTKMPSVIVVNPDTTPVSTGSYTDVAAAVGDTVVEIRTEIVQTNSFFGQYVTSGAGSGVIILKKLIKIKIIFSHIHIKYDFNIWMY